MLGIPPAGQLPRLGSFCTIALLPAGPVPPGPLELGSFCTIAPRPTPLRPRPTRPRRDWLRFAQSASLTRHPPDVPSCPSLALFCAIGPRVWVRLFEIGFVLPRLFTRPTHHNSFFSKYLPSPSAPGQLGLFRTFRPRRPRPPAPIPGRLGELGFVSHNRPRERPEAAGARGTPAPTPVPQTPPRPVGNWVCFAQSAPDWNGGMIE